MNSSNITHRFICGDIALSEDELEDLSVSGFCLRAFVNPIQETYAKIAIGLLPFPLADLLDNHLLANNISTPPSASDWLEIPLGPPLAAAVLRAPDSWGCPFWPRSARHSRHAQSSLLAPSYVVR